MKPTYFGDSYDIVKRFFLSELRSLGYEVDIDPMFTGEWYGTEQSFLSLIGANNPSTVRTSPTRKALFLDPDTGINHKGGKQHVSFDRIARETKRHNLVCAFDQSFSRQAKPGEVMRAKMRSLHTLGVRAIYYDSHARFLYASRQEEVLNELRVHLLGLGIPAFRLLEGGA
jgi:hypothetical protein